MKIEENLTKVPIQVITLCVNKMTGKILHYDVVEDFIYETLKPVSKFVLTNELETIN